MAGSVGGTDSLTVGGGGEGAVSVSFLRCTWFSLVVHSLLEADDDRFGLILMKIKQIIRHYL